jgi:N-acetylmuramoyl-L-alanine amidase
MSIGSKAAVAALSLLSLAGLSMVSSTSAVTASALPDTQEVSLLPQSVIDAAVAEQAAIPTVIEAPEEDKSQNDAPKASSLAELVRIHSATSVESREAECLAGAIYFESKGEPLVGQLAVAEVILNRAKSGRFPSSVCGVIFQPSQFSFVRGGSFPPIAKSSRAWREAVAISTIATNKLWSSGVGKALFFHADHVSPGWRLTRVAALGNHIFYR